ncbi:acyloxyacyl hydrolase [Pleomorphovibrio marinus]|uniref:acyloxyacyl hydrolase n=1 Tax=Pleomorphovibrio marinus TaxID=2164132 RepID=UPI001E40339A|nr:acyloxyacyl hydrolase [Pleomorphovibrio marinus]
MKLFSLLGVVIVETGKFTRQTIYDLMLNKAVLLCLSFLAIVGDLYGQKVKRYTIEAQYGAILAHAQDLIPVAQSNPYGIELSYQWLSMERESWLACQCFHYLGLHLSHHNFDNPQVLGTATSLSGSFEPILWKNPSFQVSLSAGMGISYLSRVYDEQTNPDNNFFSAPISFLLYLNPKLTYSFSDNWQTSLVFHYNHISNGGQSQPNRGMNFPTVGLGVSYIPSNYDFPRQERGSVRKKWNAYMEIFGTFRDAPGSERRQPVLGLTLGTYYRVGKVNGFGLGMETNIDRSLTFDGEETHGWMHLPFLSHHFLFGKFDFSQRFGYYLHKPENYQPDKLFFQRYVLSFRIVERLRVGIELKTHGHVAENIGIRLGYGF